MQNQNIGTFINEIPKAELHVHIEGTLEPELIFKLASRNKINLKFKSIEELKKAYNFHGLQSFLNVYYEGLKVLQKPEDFYELTWMYIEKARKQKVLHTEIFFDPQAHTNRGVSFETVISGISSALKNAKRELNISSNLIMCFLRHLSPGSAIETLKESVKFKDLICGVGLDSGEIGNPPKKFSEVFRKAGNIGYLKVAHAGEEGPPEYIWQALEELNVQRIDHGVRCLEDKKLVEKLVQNQIPLTVCPLSNIKLGIFNDMGKHNLKELLKHGLKVTVNSDDPAYFGGYINENFLETVLALNLTKKDICTLAKNSFEASFLTNPKKESLINKLNSFVKSYKKEKLTLV